MIPWVFNRLYLTGNSVDLEKFCKHHAIDFDFLEWQPVTYALHGEPFFGATCSSIETQEPKYIRVVYQVSSCPKQSKGNNDTYIKQFVQHMFDKIITEHDGIGVVSGQDDLGTLSIQFACPDKPPIEWIKSVSTMYPDLQFDLDYMVDRVETGTMCCTNGKVEYHGMKPWSPHDERRRVWDCSWSLVSVNKSKSIRMMHPDEDSEDESSSYCSSISCD